MLSQRSGESGPKQEEAKPYGPEYRDDRRRYADALGNGLLRPREAADILGITVTALARLARDGELPSVPTLGGHRRYRPADIRALFDEKDAHDPARTAMEEDAARLYDEGWSIRQVASRFECGYGAMRRILARRTTLRDRGGAETIDPIADGSRNAQGR
jgi:excisionase family DNA binding protein